MMATKADSRTSVNLITTGAHYEAVPLIRSEVREFPSGPEAIKPQQKAGYMRATSFVLDETFPCNAGRTIYVVRFF